MFVEWFHQFYEDYFSFGEKDHPFTVTVGVGGDSYEKVFDSSADFLLFLQSDESLTSYGYTSVEVQHLANVFNLTIHIFSHSGSEDGLHRWTHIVPQPEVVSQSPLAILDGTREKTCHILHYDEVHYDLMVPR